MAVQSSSRCCCTRLYYYFCPGLINAGETGLKVRKTVANVLIKTAYSGLVASASLLGMQYLEIRKRPVTTADGIIAAIAVTASVVSIAFRNKLVKYTARIDDMLNASNLPFEEVWEKGFSHRLDKKTLSNKFVKLAGTVRGKEFFKFTEIYDLKHLAASGIAPVAYCRFEAYDLSLEMVGHNQIQDVFPLRFSVWTTKIPKRLSAEVMRQENMYQKVKAISDQFPLRSTMLADVFANCLATGEDTGKVVVAETHQYCYVEALAKLVQSER